MPSPMQQALLMIRDNATSDPFFSNVVLLMGFQGVDASTGAPGMNDESPHLHGTANITGAAQIDTAQFRFGTSSLLLPALGDSIFYGNNADWHLGNQPFTIELQVRFQGFTPASFLIGQWGTALLLDDLKCIYSRRSRLECQYHRKR